MRLAAAVLSLLLAGGSGVVAVQDSDEARMSPLRNGEQILVKGCLRGSMLESMESGRSEENLMPSAHTFQLKGRKELLKDLEKENQRLRRQLAQTLGQLRHAGIRPAPDTDPAPARSRSSPRD